MATIDLYLRVYTELVSVHTCISLFLIITFEYSFMNRRVLKEEDWLSVSYNNENCSKARLNQRGKQPCSVKLQNVQRSDTTGDDSSSVAGYINYSPGSLTSTLLSVADTGSIKT